MLTRPLVIKEAEKAQRGIEYLREVVNLSRLMDKYHSKRTKAYRVSQSIAKSRKRMLPPVSNTKSFPPCTFASLVQNYSPL